MKYTIVVFSSRNETMRFYRIVKNYGLFASIINTPRKLASSCGISCKIDVRLISYSINIIHQEMYQTCKGIYSIELINGRELITKLY
ncbi:MAG: DUF3343 domain-containing protein [Clostridia bacterium]|nr:DUF3343 domain-containing protein [Clostridia bacterium]